MFAVSKSSESLFLMASISSIDYVNNYSATTSAASSSSKFYTAPFLT